MKFCIKKDNWILIVVVILFIINEVLIWLQEFFPSENSFINFLLALLSFPWLWIIGIFRLPFPFIKLQPLFHLAVPFVNWVLNYFTIIIFKKLLRKIKLNLKSLIILWGTNIIFFVLELLLTQFIDEQCCNVIEEVICLLTFPWGLLAAYFIPYWLPKNFVYFSFIMNSIILGILTAIYLNRRLKEEAKFES